MIKEESYEVLMRQRFFLVSEMRFTLPISFQNNEVIVVVVRMRLITGSSQFKSFIVSLFLYFTKA